MSTVYDTPAVSIRSLGIPRLLTGVAEVGQIDFSHHRYLHGDPVARSRAWLIRSAREVNLRGRGGAAFPVALKLESMPIGTATDVLVNGSESEPASHKDRTLMTAVPHLVIDGTLTVAYALGTSATTITVHDRRAYESLTRAASERSDAGDVSIVRTHNGFVGGEIRALVNGLNTGSARPDGRRQLPSERGLAHRPTFASNVETFTQIALLARLGVTNYAHTGSPAEPGTSLLTLLGDVPQPGVVEVPNGTPMDLLLPHHADAPVLIGGYHGTWLRSVRGLTTDRGTLGAAGAPLGAGVVARPFADTCVLPEMATVGRWLASESSGQCGPCYFGLPALAADLQAFADGRGSPEALARRLQQVRGRGACAHPDGAVQFMSSALVALADDIEMHRRHGSCGRPESAVLPLPGRAR